MIARTPPAVRTELASGYPPVRVRLAGVAEPGTCGASAASPPVNGLVVKALNASTFDDFARLVAEHNGVLGGCWCLQLHAESAQRGPHRRAAREDRVRNAPSPSPSP